MVIYSRAPVQRGASLDNEYSEYEEVEDRKCDHVTKNRKSDVAEDSDGLWGDDEDDDDVNDVKQWISSPLLTQWVSISFIYF